MPDDFQADDFKVDDFQPDAAAPLRPEVNQAIANVPNPGAPRMAELSPVNRGLLHFWQQEAETAGGLPQAMGKSLQMFVNPTLTGERAFASNINQGMSPSSAAWDALKKQAGEFVNLAKGFNPVVMEEGYKAPANAPMRPNLDAVNVGRTGANLLNMFALGKAAKMGGTALEARMPAPVETATDVNALAATAKVPYEHAANAAQAIKNELAYSGIGADEFQKLPTQGRGNAVQVLLDKTDNAVNRLNQEARILHEPVKNSIAVKDVASFKEANPNLASLLEDGVPNRLQANPDLTRPITMDDVLTAKKIANERPGNIFDKAPVDQRTSAGVQRLYQKIGNEARRVYYDNLEDMLPGSNARNLGKLEASLIKTQRGLFKTGKQLDIAESTYQNAQTMPQGRSAMRTVGTILNMARGIQNPARAVGASANMVAEAMAAKQSPVQLFKQNLAQTFLKGVRPEPSPPMHYQIPGGAGQMVKSIAGPAIRVYPEQGGLDWEGAAQYFRNKPDLRPGQFSAQEADIAKMRTSLTQAPEQGSRVPQRLEAIDAAPGLSQAMQEAGYGGKNIFDVPKDAREQIMKRAIELDAQRR